MMKDDVRFSLDRTEGLPIRTAGGRRVQLLLLLAGVIVALALFARIQCYPLRHDEQFFVPAGALYSWRGLYPEFGYNQPPNLPMLLHGLYSVAGSSHFLLIGRVAVFAGWLLACGAMAALAWILSASRIVTIWAVALLLTNPILLGQAGMTVTNNFLPIPFALAGLLLFLSATRNLRLAVPFSLASGFAVGIAMGFKANYIFLGPVLAVASLLMPGEAGFGTRLKRIAIPFAAGAMVGLAPSILQFATDPDGFLSHVVRYHRGAQVAYWSANDDLDGARVMTLGAKARFLQDSWSSGTMALIPLAVLVLVLACVSARTGGTRGRGANLAEVYLVGSLTLLATLISLVPTPTFPQYLAPSISLAIVLVPALYQALDGQHRAALRPFVTAGLLFTVLFGAARLFSDVTRLPRPAHWTGSIVHRQARQMAAAIGSRAGPVATLAPLYPLEAGRPIYPELAAGFVLYRVGDLLRDTEGRHYHRLASAATLGGVLERQPPAAILVGTEGMLDQPLLRFGIDHNYTHALLVPDQRGQRLALDVRPRSPLP